MSYEDELNDFLDEQERLRREAVIKDFVQLGEYVGVDVPTELLDNHKTAQEIFDFILVSEQCESCHSTSFRCRRCPCCRLQDGLCVLFSVDESRSGRKYTVHSSACCFLARLSESLFSS